MVDRRHYDAVVIGAGPAGAMAARTMALRGARTLMIDRACKGRWKVCGCCLGAVGIDALQDAGLDGVLAHAGPVERLTLSARGARVSVGMSGFASISREDLDTALVDAAEVAGVEVRWRQSARATPEGRVLLGSDELLAGVVIDASGLRSHADRAPRGGRIGLGLTTDAASCPTKMLTMAVARGGYLGRVALPDGRVDFAMAATPELVRRAGSPTEAARAIWAESGLDGAEIPDGRWFGTPVLRRRAQAQEGRILRVGDAAGYVEPFTGEGMSWALLGGSDIAYDAIACIEHGPDSSRWPRTLHGLLARRHARCRAVSNAVRSPTLVRVAIAFAGVAPSVSASATAMLSGSRRIVA